ncbi:SPOR domain-containing protein [Sphingomonas sp. MMS24-J13]|uniref:SPOR domain-containing protein n=1 Tax=Sphingomonas sp. MMS24-J13 TaxID=3238686 RepID=UPI00384F20FC
MKPLGLLLGLFLLLAAAPVPPPSAIDALRTAAAAGDAESQYRLGQAYLLGKGIVQDADTAIMWYRRAYAQGHGPAGDELGFALFSHGERKAAMPFIERSAARGDPRAFYILGTAHFNGDLATRDWPLAYAQTVRAAEAGLPAAKANLAMMEQYLLPPDRAKADIILATLPPLRRVTSAAAPAPAPTSTSAPPPPPPVPVAVTASPAPRAKGNWKVQLGAYTSADKAKLAWVQLGRKVGALGSLDQRVVAAGPVWRLQAWGLANRADAQTLCGKVRVAGGACLMLGM